MNVRNLGVLLATGAALAAGVAAPGGWVAAARAADAPAPAVAPGAVERLDLVRILDVELRRGDPAMIEPFVARAAGSAARRRAILALGRIGDRPGVEARLRALLRGDDVDLDVIARAAGLSELPALVPELLAHLPAKPGGDDEPPAALAEVLVAIGRLKDARAVGYVRPWIASKSPALARAALDAAMRLGDDTAFEDAIGALGATDAGVRRAAAFTTWRLSGARRKARGGDAWAGDAALAARLEGPATTDPDLDVRMALLRALNNLTPRELVPGAEGLGRTAALLIAATADPSPRIAADVVFRLGAVHAGPAVVDALGKAAAHADPLVRETALDALEGQKDDAAKIAYVLAMERARTEADRADVAVLGKMWVDGVDAPPAPPGPLVTPVPDTAAVRRALRALARDATPPNRLRLKAYLARADLPTALRAFLLDAIADDAAAGDWAATATAATKDADPIVRGTAAAVLLKATAGVDDPAARAPHEEAVVAAYDRDATRVGADARAGILEALPDGLPKAGLSAALKALLDRGLVDPAPTVRRAARATLGKLAPKDPRLATPDPVANDWRGLPRPKAPLLGLDLTQGGPWLSVEEILRLNDAIVERGARVVLETNRGAIELAPAAADEAPVHVANLFLCAAAGVYDGTPWHRVVPAFVIQGGDPRGDGSGDAGYSLPDEITEVPFLRGVLGMPKSTKDTGGCQLFLMHCAAPHLDGGYTAYGRATDDASLATIDRIIVGDRILKARVVDATPPR
ncbi:MAG: peptidylprolyl isomerase [Planctomycetota bacterium]